MLTYNGNQALQQINENGLRQVIVNFIYLKGIKFRWCLVSRLKKVHFAGFGDCKTFHGYLTSQF